MGIGMPIGGMPICPGICPIIPASLASPGICPGICIIPGICPAMP